MKTIRWILMIGLLCVLTASGDDLPEEDIYAESWFGREVLEPIWSGYLIVDGKYIEAPYVVERRGRAIFVNGTVLRVLLRERDLRIAENELPLDQHPGVPDDVSRETPIHETLMHPYQRKHWQYCLSLGITVAEYFERRKQYLLKWPSVREVEFVRYMGPEDNPELYYDVMMRDYMGNEMGSVWSNSNRPFAPRQFPDRSELMERIGRSLNSVVDGLRKDLVRVYYDGGLTTFGSALRERDRARWKERFLIYASDLTIEQKVEALRRGDLSAGLAIASVVETEEDAVRVDQLIAGLEATPQLWRRLDGDESWKEDAVVYEPPPVKGPE